MKLRKLMVMGTILLMAVGLVACSQNSEVETTDSKQEVSSTSAPMAKAKPEGKFHGSDKDAPKQDMLTGRVAEAMDVAGYTYVRLEDGAGHEVWAAVSKSEIAVGEVITLQDGIEMNQFHSKSLDKTFDRIIFAGGYEKVDMTAAPKPEEEVSMSGGSKGSQAEFAGEKVQKAAAANAYTVEEVFAKAASLNGQKVVIKAKAVKVSNQIMNKNWLHLQDGTGDQAKATHDLVVTTTASVNMDDVVTIEGVVATNKDFGYGYKYAVIVEDATVTK